MIFDGISASGQDEEEKVAEVKFVFMDEEDADKVELPARSNSSVKHINNINYSNLTSIRCSSNISSLKDPTSTIISHSETQGTHGAQRTLTNTRAYKIFKMI